MRYSMQYVKVLNTCTDYSFFFY